jgi:branched-chain amino acid transport system permease protein
MSPGTGATAQRHTTTSAPARKSRALPVPGTQIAALAAVAAVIIVVPTIVNPYYQSVLLLLFMYVTLALSWNLIGGFAGYFSFGHVAYFGIGAYTAAILILDAGFQWIVASILGAVAAAIAALVVGWPSLRFKGPVFAILTLAFSQTLRILVYLFPEHTGGGQGISLPPIGSLVPVYAAFAVSMASVLVLTIAIDRSMFGLHLRAIKDDELAAEAIGINTTATKLKAFVMSAAFPGFCGGVYAWYLSYIHPEDVFSLRVNVSMIVMALLGGAGTVFGPVIGAVCIVFVSEALWAQFPVLHQLIFGLAIMMLVLFMPNGIIGEIRRRSATGSGA